MVTGICDISKERCPGVRARRAARLFVQSVRADHQWGCAPFSLTWTGAPISAVWDDDAYDEVLRFDRAVRAGLGLA